MTTVGSMCSGYGGLDLGLQLALGVPLRHAWHVEYDKNPSRILAHHWPDVLNHGDLNTTDWNSVEPVDWITAGYPCQPFSHAGKRGGSDDPRHLWPAIARAVGVLRPRHVLLENVRGHVSLGLDAVLADLAGLGYDTRWGLVRASDTGAPHSRARVFIVATDADMLGRQWKRRARDGGAGPANGPESAAHAQSADAADPDRPGLEGCEPAPRHVMPAWGAYEPAITRWEHVLGRPAPRPTEPGRNGERLSPRFVEFMMGLPDGWVTDVPGLSRNAQLKILGNGVVPQQGALALRMLGVTTSAAAA